MALLWRVRQVDTHVVWHRNSTGASPRSDKKPAMESVSAVQRRDERGADAAADVRLRGVRKTYGGVIADLTATPETHRRVLAVLAYLRG
jgi:hypothetical protein